MPCDRMSLLTAVTAGGAALIFVLAVGQVQPAQQWTATGSSQAIRVIAPMSGMSQQSSQVVAFADAIPMPPQYATGQIGESSIKATASLVFAASGLFTVIAAVRWFLAKGFGAVEYPALKETDCLMVSVSGVDLRAQRERHEREKAERAQREIQERLERLKRMGLFVPDTKEAGSGAVRAAPVAVAAATPVAAANDWERRQQERENLEKAKAEAARREIEERLARLAKLSSAQASAPVHDPTPVPVASAAVSTEVSEWERRQQRREQQEREKAEKAQREIQERLQRLKGLGASVPSTSAAPAPVEALNDWEKRQQERARQEQEKKFQAQREIQERLARLANLTGSPAPVVSAPAELPAAPASPVTAAAANEWERRQQERERQERERAERAQREIQERLQRLQQLTSQV